MIESKNLEQFPGDDASNSNSDNSPDPRSRSSWVPSLYSSLSLSPNPKSRNMTQEAIKNQIQAFLTHFYDAIKKMRDAGISQEAKVNKMATIL